MLHIQIEESESEKVMKKDEMPLALYFQWHFVLVFNKPLLLRFQDRVQMHKDSEGIKLTFLRLSLEKKCQLLLMWFWQISLSLSIDSAWKKVLTTVDVKYEINLLFKKPLFLLPGLSKNGTHLTEEE